MRFINALVACSVIAITSSSVLAQSTAVQWTTASGGNGHWYQCLRTTGFGEVWNVSQAAANVLGGHLATLTSQQENSWAYELSVAQNAWSGRVGPLLGGYKLPNNSFRWVTDEPWAYTSWLSGEPSSGLWEPYLSFLGPQDTSSSGATWNDTDAINHSGDPTYTYIVEWSADCNSDGIVDYGQILSGELIDANSNGIPDCCESGTACEVNLIQNGGFEFGPIQPDCSWVIHSLGSPFVSGWSVVTASVDRVRLSLMCPPTQESWMSYEGEYTVDMDGDAAGGAIAQTVQTIPGVPYRLSFELTGNCAPGTKRMSVEIGQVSAQFEHVCTASNPQAWSKKTIDFTAIDLQTTIVMRSLMNDGRNGPVIDDVRLVVHPSDPCPGDISGNGAVDGVDLSVLLGVWGTDGSGGEFDADVTNDGIVNGADLTIILGGWGPCPN